MNKSFVNKALFWLGVVIFLTIIFGYTSKDYFYTFYFVASMLPVVVATSYFFNRYLVPQYLQKGRYLNFALYLLYTIILSLWLEMLIMVLAFIMLANYNYAYMYPEITNIVYLALALYFIVFVDGFRLTYLKLQAQQKAIDQLALANKDEFITVKVDRKNQKILFDDLLYIESLGDYLKLHTKNGTYINREKVSKIGERLPKYFIRIHRSFIVNSKQINTYTKEYVKIGEQEIPISRTYKNQALDLFEQKT